MNYEQELFYEDLRKNFPIWRKRPVLFAREMLHKEPDPEQQKLLNAVAKYDMVAFKSGHGVGKTFDASIIVPWWITCWPHSRAITTAPTGRQVKEVTWAEIHKTCQGTPLHQFMEFQTTKIKVSESWGALGTSSDKPENIEGFHADNLLFLVDEAKGVCQPIFDAIMGTQTTKTKLVLFSTPSPNPLGEFFNAFKPDSLYNPPHGINMTLSCLDSPRPGMKRYIKMMKKKYGEKSPVYQMKVLGEFPDVSEDTLIPWQQVNSSVNRKIVIDHNKEFKRIICCDPARFGMDITVIMVVEWQKQNERWVKKLVDCEFYGKQPTNYTTGRLHEKDKKWKGDEIRVDAGGGDIGAGVVDQLMQIDDIKHKVVAFVAGGKSNFTEEDNNYYLNWKSKSYDSLRRDFELGIIDIYDVGDLLEQLILLRKDYTTGGKLKILDYDEEIKSTDVKHKSPDFSDCLNIGCANLQNESFFVLEDAEGII